MLATILTPASVTIQGAQSEAPAFPKVLVVVHRRNERLDANAQEIPFRNSPLRIYRLEGNVYEAVSKEWMSRSTTTSSGQPLWDDVPSPAGKAVLFGHQSLPLGLYSLQKAVWKDRVSVALHISAYGSRSGIIPLQENQVLSQLTFPDVDPGFGWVPEICHVASRRYKSEVYIHPSPTMRWSHQDSLGCINLSIPSDLTSSEPADYHDFEKRLQEVVDLDSTNEDPYLLGLLVLEGLPFDVLPNRLETEFLAKLIQQEA